MAEPAAWTRLSQSSQRAMRWAWAAASLRPGRPTVTTLDLLAGLLVAHGDGSEPWQLFQRFHVAPGTVLAAGSSSRVRGAQLRAAFERANDGPPPLDRAVELTMRMGVSELTMFDPDGLLTFKALFGALLLTVNPASTAIQAALDEQGAPSSEVFDSYREYLGGSETYDAFLKTRFPWPPPRELPAYATDRPPLREAPADPGDLVRISAEVDAFAFLIASKTLPPPLAVGLFGDWGSGKSYFIRTLQRRIDRLRTDGLAHPDDDLPFHRSIAQIEFNAWQYVQGDLWASLLDHIIRHLDPAPEPSGLFDRARQQYLDEIRRTTDQNAVLRREKVQLEDARITAAAEVERRHAERGRALAELREHPLRTLAATPAVRDSVKQVAEKAGVGALAAQADDAARVLADRRAGAAARHHPPVGEAVRQRLPAGQDHRPGPRAPEPAGRGAASVPPRRLDGTPRHRPAALPDHRALSRAAHAGRRGQGPAGRRRHRGVAHRASRVAAPPRRRPGDMAEAGGTVLVPAAPGRSGYGSRAARSSERRCSRRAMTTSTARGSPPSNPSRSGMSLK